MSGAYDPAVLAATQAELGEATIPWPDDYVGELSPHAALLLLRQMGMAALRVVTAAVVDMDDGSTDEQPVVAAMVNGCAAAIMGATHALVALGVLPVAAEGETKAAMPSAG